jgi:ubiquinone/menaquinone biosynthesis C-methylase UbiE
MFGPVMSASDVWNEILAPKFIRYRRVLVEGATPHGQRALALFPTRPADAVLDVGCGFGDATLAIADQVGPLGSVVGLDVGYDFLELARELHEASGKRNVAFMQADAETYPARESFDYLFARFGTMFFERPVAAFRNMRAMLRPGGQLTMTVWRSSKENPWLSFAKPFALARLPAPGEEAATCGPGPFSQASPSTVHELLTRAGFREVSFTPSDGRTRIGDTLDEAIAFQLAIGPAGEIVREAGALGERALPALKSELESALAPYLEPDGVWLPAAAWVVHARV